VAFGPDGHLDKGYLYIARICNGECIFDCVRRTYCGIGLAGLFGSIGC
jgi:hypothetical protein